MRPGTLVTSVVRTALGVAALWGVERFSHGLLGLLRIQFPSSVAGMVVCCGVVMGVRSISVGAADMLTTALEPARQFLARWMAVFFVPPLVLLPLTPLPGAYDLVVGSIVLGGGFAANLLATAAVAQLGGEPRGAASETITVSGTWPRWLVFGGWLSVATIAGLGSAGALGVTSIWFRAVFGVAVGVVGFSLGETIRQKLASRGFVGLAAICHPVSSCMIVTCLAWTAVGLPLSEYLTHGRGLSEPTRPGNLLVAMLTPAVVAFGLGLDAQRVLLRQGLVRLLSATAFVSLFSMYSTALASRLLGLSDLYAKALLSRAVTTPVALVMARGFDADPGLTAVFVVFSGLLGALFALPLLGRARFSNPLVVGVATGAASHGIGTAALVKERPKAVAFSATAFALTAFFSGLFASVPAIRDSVLWLLG